MRRGLAVITIAAVGLLPMPATAQTAPTCFGMEVTILGTEGKDQLFGGSGHDVISALGEHDYVRGFEGWYDPDLKDWICGGTGPDALNGDSGNDWIDGEQGEDYIGGDDGQDRLFGGGGNDTINGHWGSDFVDGGPGADLIRNDHDRAVRWSSDILHGGEGGDIVGEDSVHGHATGSDALYGDAGNDNVDGRDWLHEEGPSTPDLVDGGPGNDRCWADPDDTVINCEEITIVS